MQTLSVRLLSCVIGKTWLIGTGAVLLSYGCGSAQNSSTTNVATPSERVLMVVMGGNDSCGDTGNGPTPYGMNMYEPFHQMVDRIQINDHIDTDYVLSCYTSSATVYYTTSEHPNDVYSGTPEQVFAEISGIAGRQAPARIMIAGHSYGGWLAMKSALGTNLQLSSLFTIDPISRETCSVLHPLGCQSAPTDITDPQREQIRTRVSTWDNFYQNRTLILHSSAITQANSNLELDVPHTQIDTDTHVWNDITNKLERRFHHLMAAAE